MCANMIDGVQAMKRMEGAPGYRSPGWAGFTLIELPFDELRITHQRKRCAFTLIELLAIIAIVVLLLALASPLVSRALILTRQIACGSNQHQIITAQLTYAAENRGRVPVIRSHVPCCLTNRSGFLGWTECRHQFYPYLGADPGKLFYCPASLKVPGYPNKDNYGSFSESYGKGGIAGYGAIPITIAEDPWEATGGPGHDYYVYIDYNLFAGYVRTNHQVWGYQWQAVGAGHRMHQLSLADEEIAERPNWGFSQPPVAESVYDCEDTARVAMTGDKVWTRYPTSLVDIQNGPFVPRGLYSDEEYMRIGTIVESHYFNGKMEGMNAGMMDGHVQWRPVERMGPRINVDVGVPGSYQYVFWY